MTRTHVIALADALRRVKPKRNTGCEGDMAKNRQWRLCVEAVADVCAEVCKGSFKGQRFLDYCNGLCGPGGGKR